MLDKHTVKPINGYILTVSENRTEVGNIILPEDAKSKARTGRIVAISKVDKEHDGYEVLSELSIGDVVYYSEWGAKPMVDVPYTLVDSDGKEFNKKSLFMMKWSDILGVITPR